jgi:hypothetical protein
MPILRGSAVSVLALFLLSGGLAVSGHDIGRYPAASLISMPWSLAQARTAWVSMPLTFRLAPRLIRRMPPTLRAWGH